MQNADRDHVADPDRGWVPRNRPQSTMARNFSATLDDLFKMDGDLDTLSKTVHQKKIEVSSRSQELEALEARLRATEERLKRAGNEPADFPTSRKNSQRRTPIKGTFDADDDTSAGAAYTTSAGTAAGNIARVESPAMSAIPGAFPGTAKAAEGRGGIAVKSANGM